MKQNNFWMLLLIFGSILVSVISCTKSESQYFRNVSFVYVNDSNSEVEIKKLLRFVHEQTNKLTDSIIIDAGSTEIINITFENYEPISDNLFPSVFVENGYITIDGNDYLQSDNTYFKNKENYTIEQDTKQNKIVLTYVFSDEIIEGIKKTSNK